MKSSPALVLLLVGTAVFAAPPRLDALSKAQLTPGEFVHLHGEFFGSPGPAAYVEIGGKRVATGRWTDTLITAWASEGVVAGQYAIRVITPTGASNSLQLEVLPQPPPVGRVAWRFRAEGFGGHHRPTVGADGTVYFGDQRGFVYALAPDGQVRWVYDASAASGAPAMADWAPVALGSDGMLYVAVDPLGPESQVHAIAPDGTLQWIHHANLTSNIAGPSVGPDGNIYVLYDSDAGGLVCLSPQGTVLWENAGSQPFAEYAVRGAEIVFGRGSTGELDQLYFATDQSGSLSVQPKPSLWGFGLNGTERFRTDTGSHPAFAQGQPVVAPDGTVYLSARHNLVESINAYDPDGQRLWSWAHPSASGASVPAITPEGTVFVVFGGGVLSSLTADGTFRFNRSLSKAGDQMSHRDPVMHPSGNAVVLASVQSGPPDTGVMALESRTTFNGALRWREVIPVENGFRFGPTALPVVSGDGARIYLPASQPGVPAGEETWVLFAFDEDACLSAPEGCAPVEPDAGTAPPDDAGILDAGTVPIEQPDAGSPLVVDDGGHMDNPSAPAETPASGCNASGAGAFGGLFLFVGVVWRRRARCA